MALAGRWYNRFVIQHEAAPGKPKYLRDFSDQVVWNVIRPEAPETTRKQKRRRPSPTLHPWWIMEIAQTSRSSFETYRTLEYEKFGNANDATYTEADKRLRQLCSILKDVSALCNFSADLQHAHTWSDEQKVRYGLGQIERADRIELLTEAFYWIAHRASSAIRHMPGLKPFTAVGVRDVRNRMLEHVDKPSGIRWVGFGWGGPAGPTLATVPYGKDKGLFVNADEFFAEVERVTSHCIKNPELIC